MALCLNSLVTRQLGKLSLGLSRTTVRLSHSSSKRKKQQERVDPGFEPGHAEKIWIFHHILDGMTVYSLQPVLKAARALRQIAFNGKKLKPSKIRKDYWRPLALIQLPTGYGEAGRSVYQRLRECKTLHELAWSDGVLYDKKTGRTLTKNERGHRLNDQKANTVADMAAVLGGVGKGNKIRPEVVLEAAEEAEAEAAVEAPEAEVTEGAEAAEETPVEGRELAAPLDAAAGQSGKTARAEHVEPSSGLLKVTVFWSDLLDKAWAKEWPANVTHATFENAGLQPLEAVAEEAAAAVEGEALAAEGQEVNAQESQQKAPADLVANEELRGVSEEPRRPSP